MKLIDCFKSAMMFQKEIVKHHKDELNQIYKEMIKNHVELVNLIEKSDYADPVADFVEFKFNSIKEEVDFAKEYYSNVKTKLLFETKNFSVNLVFYYRKENDVILGTGFIDINRQETIVLLSMKK